MSTTGAGASRKDRQERQERQGRQGRQGRQDQPEQLGQRGRQGRPEPTRRERLRAQTVREIKETATRHMDEGGVAALSLRAIARDMGMTPGALYNYFDTRDDLLTALIADVYDRLAGTLAAARDAHPADATSARLRAHALAYRTWAVTTPQEFRLLYGDPAPGYSAPPGSAAAAAEHRLCLGLLDLVAAAWPTAEPLQSRKGHTWSAFNSGFTAPAREAHPDLPPAAVALTLRVWGRLHGLVSLEVYGHLTTETDTPERVYEDEVSDLIHALGLPPA